MLYEVITFFNEIKHDKLCYKMRLKAYVIVITSYSIHYTKLYDGLINDRNSKSVTLMVSAEGGVEIEEVAKNNPELIHKFNINPQTGLLDFQARNVAMKLFKDVKLARKAADIFQKLYQIFLDTDSTSYNFV